MSKSVSFLFAAMLAALGAGPAFAQAGVGQSLQNLGDDIATLQEALGNIQLFLEPKTIFVTSTPFDGDLGGVEGGDQKCQDLANASVVVPEGEYVALLSDDDENASSRLTSSIGRIIRSDGVLVAWNLQELFGVDLDGEGPTTILRAPIDRDEDGTQVSGEVWTATNRKGTKRLPIGAEHCANWMNGTNAFLGHFGSSDLVDQQWVEKNEDDCNILKHLYCVQR